MKKVFLIIASLIIAASFSLGVVYNHSAQALSFKNFDPSNIIDDATFYDSKSMSAGQVQSFLDKKVPSCDTQGSGSYEGTTVKKYWTPLGEPAPYTCLKDWKQNTPKTNGVSGLCSNIPKHTNRSGAEIITDIAKACGVSPKVLLVLLEKEKSLISDKSPLSHNSKWSQYKYATGFGCPDTAPCDPEGAGFFNQVYSAAYQFKLYRANPTNYNYIAHQSNYVQYNPNKKCGGSRITIKNQATAGLYNYTPYQPNKATLAVPAGVTAKCGAYGNKNFWFLFTTWFGSTTNNKLSNAAMDIDYRYNQLGGVTGILGVESGSIKQTQNKVGYYQGYKNGYIIWSAKTGAWETLGPIRAYWKQIGLQDGKMGYAAGPITDTAAKDGTYQKYQNGYIIGKKDGSTGYWESKGGIRSGWQALGLQTGAMGYPAGPEIKSVNGGYLQKYEKGNIYWSPSAGSYGVAKSKFESKYKSLGAQKSWMGYPVSNEVKSDDNHSHQLFQNGGLYWTKDKGTFITKGGINTRYIKLGGANSQIGFPLSDELKAPGGGAYQIYEKGFIYWSSKTSAWDVKGPIYTRWSNMNDVSGKMGYPVGAVTYTAKRDGIYQKYQNGYIIGKNSTGYWESKGGIRNYWSKIGLQTGKAGYPIGPEKTTKDGEWAQKYQNGTIYYSSSKGSWYEAN